MSYDICEELIVEIFTRLPAKSLLRFRSISKSLCECIGSPVFIRLHARQSPNKIMAIHHLDEEACSKDMYTLHSAGQPSCIDITPVECPFETFRIVGSCNGIVCVYEYNNHDYLHLWNPSIRRKLTIQYSPSWSGNVWQPGPIGFGFDPIVNDYKILARAERGDEVSTFVYTVKTSSWREIASPTMDRLTWVHPWQCVSNGALHWVVRRYLTDSHDDCHHYILTFDLSSEVFSTTEVPQPSWETNVVTIINDSLTVISSKHDERWIWVRNNIDASLSVAYKLDIHVLTGAYKLVFQFTANDDLLFSPNYSWITTYNLKTQAQRRFMGLGDSWHMFLSVSCVESLGLLDMGTSCHQGRKSPERKEKHNK